MPRNKPRVQLALYARPKHPTSPHYALYIASKSNKGLITKHHVKNTLLVDDTQALSQPWRYEQLDIADIDAEMSLLVRVTIAKVTKSRDHIEQLLQSVPIYQKDDPDQVKAESFNCRTWVIEAYHRLENDQAVASGSIKWQDLEQKARDWIDQQQQQGRWRNTSYGSPDVPVLDLLTGNEVGT